MPSELVDVTRYAEEKRVSVYQSSSRASKFNEAGVLERRRKISSSYDSNASFPSAIIDCLTQSSRNESSPYTQLKKSTKVSLNCELNSRSVRGSYVLPNPQATLDPYCLQKDCPRLGKIWSSDDFLEICFEAEDEEWESEEETVAVHEKVDLVEDKKFRCYQTTQDDKSRLQVDMIHKPPMFLKEGMKSSLCQMELNQFEVRHKAFLNSQRPMTDVAMKPPSCRSPSFVADKEIGSTRNKVGRVLFHDCSKIVSEMKSTNSPLHKKDAFQAKSRSPAHLHGFLKLEHNNGMPFFEFSLTDPKDVFGAQIWRSDDTFNWVYTFHYLNGKRKISSMNHRQKSSSLLGQMLVYCHIRSEVENCGSMLNSTLTEFISYDLTPLKRNFAEAQVSSRLPPNSVRPIEDHLEQNGLSDTEGYLSPSKCPLSDGKRKTLSSHYQGHMKLHAHLETVAIVIHAPFEKRESVKDSGIRAGEEKITSISDFSALNSRGNTVLREPSFMNVKVLTPSGRHGLPTSGDGPTPLLDRWRSGGRCDCGGWDLACPLNVFSCPNVIKTEDYLFTDKSQPFELFLQGMKGKLPSLSITWVSDGKYYVDFHAQLSTLQAFSICIAVLHSTKVPTEVRGERNTQELQGNSFEIFKTKDAETLFDFPTVEEKRHACSEAAEMSTCFILDPPVSPMARV